MLRRRQILKKSSLDSSSDTLSLYYSSNSQGQYITDTMRIVLKKINKKNEAEITAEDFTNPNMN